MACTPDWCKAIDLECPRCHRPYCRDHYAGHYTRLVVPRDAWRTARRKVRIQQAAFIEAHGREALDALPFLVGSYCKTPDGRRARAPCGYESTACAADLLGCLRCKFTYCTQHFRGHVVRFSMPRRVLLKLLKQFQDQLDEVAAGRRKVLRIRVLKAQDWRGKR